MPSVSSSLALSTSPLTRWPSVSSLPVRMERWILRADGVGRTLSPSEIDCDWDGDGVEALYADARRLALKWESAGLDVWVTSCVRMCQATNIRMQVVLEKTN